MVFAYVEAQKVLGGKVFLTLGTAISVDLGVVYFEIFEGGECEGFGVRC